MDDIELKKEYEEWISKSLFFTDKEEEFANNYGTAYKHAAIGFYAGYKKGAENEKE